MKWSIYLTRENVEFIIKRHIAEVNNFKTELNPLTGSGGCIFNWGHDLDCTISGPVKDLNELVKKHEV